MTRGDPPGALEAYQRGLEIARELARDQTNAQAQRELSVCRDKIGNLSMSLGTPAASAHGNHATGLPQVTGSTG